MKVYCIRCKKEFEIKSAQLEQIKMGQLETFAPIDYLELLPMWAGRCTREGFETKKHSFDFTEDFKAEYTNLGNWLEQQESNLHGLEMEEQKLDEEIPKLEKLLEDKRQREMEISNDKATLIGDINRTKDKLQDIGIEDVKMWLEIPEEVLKTLQKQALQKQETKEEAKKKSNESKASEEYIYKGLNVVGVVGEQKQDVQQTLQIDTEVFTKLADVNKPSTSYNIKCTVTGFLDKVENQKQKGTIMDEAGNDATFVIWKDSGSKIQELEENHDYILRNVLSAKKLYEGKYDIVIRNSSKVEKKD